MAKRQMSAREAATREALRAIVWRVSRVHGQKKKLAEALGMSQPWIAQVLKGKIGVGAEHIAPLAAFARLSDSEMMAILALTQPAENKVSGSELPRHTSEISSALRKEGAVDVLPVVVEARLLAEIQKHLNPLADRVTKIETKLAIIIAASADAPSTGAAKKRGPRQGGGHR